MEAIFGTDTNAILIIVAAVAVIVAACAVIFPWLKRKGVDIAPAYSAAGGVLDGAGAITNALKAVFPKSLIANVADKIISYAKTGVEKAEQLYIIHKITGADRKTEATAFVYEALALAGIAISPAIDKIVDGAIEAAVLALGHEYKPPDDCEGYGGDVMT